MLTTTHIDYLRGQLTAAEKRLADAQAEAAGWRHLLTYATANGPQTGRQPYPDPLADPPAALVTVSCACGNASDPSKTHGTFMCDRIADPHLTAVMPAPPAEPGTPKHRISKGGKP